MTTPFISVTAAIFYFAWLWHNRSAVERREGSLEHSSIKETNQACPDSHYPAVAVPSSRSQVGMLPVSGRKLRLLPSKAINLTGRGVNPARMTSTRQVVRRGQNFGHLLTIMTHNPQQ
jgi:hypothetical protein